MQNEPNQTNLTSIFKIIFINKLPIIIFTLIFAFSFAIYESSKPKVYNSNAKIILASFDNTNLQDFARIKPLISFFYSSISINNLGDKFISISTSGDSIKNNEKKLNDVILFLKNDSKTLIQKKQAEIFSEIDEISFQIKLFELELDRVNKTTFDKSEIQATHDLRTYAHDLVNKITLNNSKVKKLKGQISKTDLFVITNQYGKITTYNSNPKSTKNIIAFAIIGFIFSFFYIFVRDNYLSLMREK
tara:strand:+ start:4234 stop:4971 length:738 start_codon:yes stop_codon:yes gene_type:complete